MRLLILLAAALSLITPEPGLAATAMTIGNVWSNTTYSDFPGQIFSPSVPGNAGRCDVDFCEPFFAPDLLTLMNFEIGYVDPVNSGSLYVFKQEYTGRPAGLSSLQVGGLQGLIGKSSVVVDSVWDFGRGVVLPSMEARYYVYSDVASAYRSYVLDGTAYGGTELRGLFADPSAGDITFTGIFTSDEDIVFRAELRSTPEPETLAPVAIGLLILPVIRCRLKRRFASLSNQQLLVR